MPLGFSFPTLYSRVALGPVLGLTCWLFLACARTTQNQASTDQPEGQVEVGDSITATGVVIVRARGPSVKTTRPPTGDQKLPLGDALQQVFVKTARGHLYLILGPLVKRLQNRAGETVQITGQVREKRTERLWAVEVLSVKNAE